MSAFKLKSLMKNALMLTSGAFLCAIAINIFYLPSRLTMGGITGVASIIYQLVKMPLPFGIFVALINLPLFIFGGLKISRRFIINSMIGTVVYSLVIDFTEPAMVAFYDRYMVSQTNGISDLFLASIVGGVCYGIGLGLMLFSGYTTGGTDILAILFRRKFSHFSLGQVIWVMDAVVIASSAYFYRNSAHSSITITLYSAISVFLTSKGIDFVLEGINFQRTAFIITEQRQNISQRIMAELDRGLTSLKGNGVYTGKEQHVLLCVLSKEQIGRLKQIVTDEDPKAFVFVMDTREVVGEGFGTDQYLK